MYIMDGMRLTTLHLPEQMYQKIKKLSASSGLSKAEHIRRAIDAYLRKLPQETKTEAVENGQIQED